MTDKPAHQLFPYCPTIFAAADLEGVGKLLAVGKLMQVLVDAMARSRGGNVHKPTPFSIINFDAALVSKLVKAVIRGAEKIQPPTANRADISEPFLFNILGQVKRDIE